MSVRVNFPKAGMGIDEGTVIRWLKTPGERVQQGEVIVEIETAKAIQEVEAPASGTLLTIVVGAGEVVGVNNTLALIEDAGG